MLPSLSPSLLVLVFIVSKIEIARLVCDLGVCVFVCLSDFRPGFADDAEDKGCDGDSEVPGTQTQLWNAI